MSLSHAEFQRLYETQQPFLLRQFRRQYRALADDVEDVVQDSFDKLWRRFGEHSDPSTTTNAVPDDLKGWLFRTVNNAMIDRTRMHKRRPPTDIDEIEVTGSPADRSRLDEARQDAGATLGAPGLDDEEEDQIGDALDVMHEVLPQLKERDRVLLTLKYIDGLSYEEIAPRLGMSRGALGTTLLRARRAAQALFEERIARKRAERGTAGGRLS